MLKDIHPEYKEIKATCSCGNVITVQSTLKEDITLDVCSACHPFYTGQQKLVDTSGRVERFEKRFGKKQGSPKKDPDKDQEAKKEEKVEAKKEEKVEAKKEEKVEAKKEEKVEAKKEEKQKKSSPKKK